VFIRTRRVELWAGRQFIASDKKMQLQRTRDGFEARFFGLYLCVSFIRAITHKQLLELWQTWQPQRQMERRRRQSPARS
jgi:hypothetical protein